MKNPTTEELAAFEDECWDALDAWDASENVEQLSTEDVDSDGTQIFGAFGAEHEEPEPLTPLECQVLENYKGRMTTQNREVINRFGEE